MKTLFLFISFFASVLFLSAQINSTTPWTWMKGDNTTDQLGVYGTQGIAANSNKPGARNSSTTWRDASGNLWLFGGSGYGASALGYLNDLWKYNTGTNVWTWVKGDSVTNQNSEYGIRGVGSVTNKPGGSFASVSWIDASGALWLFGGFGYTDTDFGFLNTLWKLNPLTKEWTWVNGEKTIDEPGIYGVKGITNSSNKPGARYGSQTWVDESGNLWLYGGYGFDHNTTGILNDVWKYDPSTNRWTWVSGDNENGQIGIYGVKGTSSPANKPGARYASTSWKDTNGDLWLFGGYGYDENDAGSLNDLWKYNSAINQWTWMSGDKIIDQTGDYGVPDIQNNTSKPGSRYVSSSWLDASGSLWLFGGYGYDETNPGYLNDLWKYDPSTGRWTWIKGDSKVDQPSIYGIQGMPALSNKSGARTGSVSWTDGNGNLWLFGGYGIDDNTSGVLNDLWKITNLQVPLPLHLLEFNGALSNNAVQLRWLSEQETDFSHFNIQRSFDGTAFNTIAKKDGSGTNNKKEYIYVDLDLKNQTTQKIFYRLQLMDKDGGFTYSKILAFNLNSAVNVDIFPNPAVQSINISFEQNKSGRVTISVTDMNGSLVKKQTETISSGRATINTDVSILASGTYLLTIANEDGNLLKKKFIKQ